MIGWLGERISQFLCLQSDRWLCNVSICESSLIPCNNDIVGSFCPDLTNIAASNLLVSDYS